ncbi:hypothetical protein SEVIR_3G356632v4 [Setaria viridis]
MSRNGVVHQAAINVMSELFGSWQNWPFTEKDVKNKNAAQAREGRDGDLKKLFQFFRECKASNEYFYWDVDFDPKTKVLRSIFWCHASQRVKCKDFGDVITFDTTHKTTACLWGSITT